MWLLNVDTLKPEYYIEVNSDEQKYAILSHAWGPKEVTFAEMLAWEPGGLVEEKLGFDKVKRFCEQAKADGYRLAWVDTCCIDKTSSAELSESINSMFRWYHEAQVCYVFMSDVSAANAFEGLRPGFPQSRWFTRGWTLQELIAPAKVRFFSKEWQMIGTKRDLCKEIHTITKIDEDILLGTEDLQRIPASRRMSWAAKRVTTRTEDIAYCLLGIFNVNMPMLYGEGRKAFTRLQEAIIASSNDHTIFAWSDPSAPDTQECSLLAPHPSCFEHSADWMTHYPEDMLRQSRSVIEFSSRGVSIHAFIDTDREGRRRAFLNCFKGGKADSFAFIYLNGYPNYYPARTCAAKLGEGCVSGKEYTLSVPRYPKIPKVGRAPSYTLFSLKLGRFEICTLTEVFTPARCTLTSKNMETSALLHHRRSKWVAVSTFGDPSQYGYGASNPGTCASLLKLSYALIKEGRRIPHYLIISIGALKNGRLAAKLFDGQTLRAELEDHDAENFRGVESPGLSECRVEGVGTFVLKISELSAAEALYGGSGMFLEVSHRNTIRLPER